METAVFRLVAFSCALTFAGEAAVAVAGHWVSAGDWGLLVAVLVVAFFALAVWLLRSVFLSIVSTKSTIILMLRPISLLTVGVGWSPNNFILIFNYNFLKKVINWVILSFLSR